MSMSDVFTEADARFFGIDDEAFDGETGKPGVGLFANAVQIWSLQQDHITTVDEAAKVFACEPEMVAAAVKWHPWMLLEGGSGAEWSEIVIAHEGE